MKVYKGFRLAVFFSLGLTVLGLAAAVYAFPGDENWLQNADGYIRARNQAVSSGQPMVVYFYTDWCPYCRKFEKNALADPDVQKALTTFVKVRINPEKGLAENQLADQYGIGGFPSVYFENPSVGKKPREIGSAIQNANAFISAIQKFNSGSD